MEIFCTYHMLQYNIKNVLQECFFQYIKKCVFIFRAISNRIRSYVSTQCGIVTVYLPIFGTRILQFDHTKSFREYVYFINITYNRTCKPIIYVEREFTRVSPQAGERLMSIIYQFLHNSQCWHNLNNSS